MPLSIKLVDVVVFGQGLAPMEVFSNLNDSRILRTESGEASSEVL